MKRLVWALLVTFAAPLTAQQPQFRGRGEPELDVLIREWLRDSEREVWTRDTLLTRNDTVDRPLLILGATVRLEGTLRRDVVAIGANVFVRPGARVEGNVRSIAGGWYASTLASITGSVQSEPNAPYEVVRDETGPVVIVGTVHPRLIQVEPVLPTYDRVDGVSVGAGVALIAPALGRLEPALRAWGIYRSERGQFDPGVEARLERGATSLAVGAERTTLTNEEWIRSAMPNSIRYLWSGKDYRDYYEAERAWAELRRRVERGERTTEVWVRGQVEDAASLYADDPWSVLKPDSVRSNLAIDEGRITSVWLGGNTLWERPTFVTEFDVRTELGIDALDSDYVFQRFEITGEFAMLALRNHTLDFEVHFRGPLDLWQCADCPGPEYRTPRQRWSYVGGSGTLYTFDDAQFRGDRVAFVETSYSIPLPNRFRTPFLGVPALEFMHMTGMAWSDEQQRAFEHNVGLRLRYSVAYLRVVTNPDDPGGDIEFSAGVSFPRKGHTWDGR